MDLDDLFGDIEGTEVVASIVIWLVISAMFWVLPSLIGVQDYNLLTKIIVSAASLPASFIIVHIIANK